MPWAGKSYERTIKVYKELLKETIKEIDSDIDLKIKDLLIRADIQKRDFTKRQMNILYLILSLSFPYGKEKALLKPNDFSLTGVPLKIIKGELEKLIEMNIIEWDQDFNEFSVKEARFWKAPYHKHYDDKESQRLFILNLRHAGVDTTLILEKLKEMNL